MPLDLTGELVIEHGETPLSRRLRRNRIRIALAVAAIEGIAVLATAVPWWAVVLLASGALAAYLALRGRGPAELAQLTWIAAVSQLLLVVVPVVAAVVVALAILVIVLFAAVALAALFSSRR